MIDDRAELTEVNEHYEVLGIRECTRCGDTGDENQKYGVDGIARIAGNLCVDCVRELDDRFTEKRAVTDGGRDQSAVVTERLTHTEGGHRSAWWFDKDRGEALVECEVCGEAQLRTKTDKEVEPYFKVKYVDGSDEGEISDWYVGNVCSAECLETFAKEIQ